MSAIVRRRRITAASPTPEKLATFLRHLEESGSVSFAAQRTGIGRNTVYELRKVDPEFAHGWEKAAAMAVETLRDIAITRARDGTERELWRRGKRVGTIREYDNRLLQFLLRALQPEVYGRRGR
ncbi:MAG: hypothetical protein Q8L22_14940 [Reyranella sp.]|nr:hypothetical protein [Reyranella sp.]